MPPPRKKAKLSSAGHRPSAHAAAPLLTASGRPLRHAARKSQAPSDFTDSGLAISDSESSSETDEDSSSESTKVPARPARRCKIKRSPSPELLPDHLLGWHDHRDPSQSPSETDSHSLSPVDTRSIPLSFTFHIPVGFHGPFTINLDARDLLRAQDQATRRTTHLQSSPKHQTMTRPHGTTVSQSLPGTTGFLDLPAELRNHIYRLVFVTDQRRLDFSSPKNFSRSSALLRTCSTVATEGSSLLYSECDFFFRRHSSSRRPMWGTEGKEVGFEDVHRFLKQIGPTNVGRLRHVFFLLEDAVPCLNPHLKTTEERRYVHDRHLKAALRLLADHGRLQSLKLGFFGRRAITEADSSFLDEVKAVRADTVEVLARRCHPEWPRLYSNLQWPKIMFNLAVEVKKASTRRKKFYPPPVTSQRRAHSDNGSDDDDDQQEPRLCQDCGQLVPGDDYDRLPRQERVGAEELAFLTSYETLL